ncbi:MAG: isopentenyl phosphate kinase [Ignisphaera sp.]
MKLGGALLTDKSKPFSLRYSVLNRISREIAHAYRKCTSRIIVIHGGGSFGHYVVEQHDLLHSCDAISQTIWFMREMNMIIADALSSFGIPVIPFDTHALTTIENNEIHIHLKPITYALSLNLVPLLYGDIVLKENGADIVSGDEISWYLGKQLKPSRILFATTVDGVYDKDPANPDAKIIRILKLSDLRTIDFGKAKGVDVTGGMKTKLFLGLKYLDEGIREILIFSGFREGFVYKAICGYDIEGTKVID